MLPLYVCLFSCIFQLLVIDALIKSFPWCKIILKVFKTVIKTTLTLQIYF